MEFFLANVSGAVRRVTRNGRKYLVAPMSLIVPGVLNGSKGPLYYPPKEVSKGPGIWNGMPLMVNHPYDAHGQPVSASDKEAQKRQKIGFAQRDRVVNGKRMADGWFDVEETRKKSPGILNALENNQAIELSTGLFTNNIPAPKGSTWNGKPYEHVAKDYKPDHVAILHDQVGACSLNDGCGVNNSEATVETPKTIWRKLGEMLGVYNGGPAGNAQSRAKDGTFGAVAKDADAGADEGLDDPNAPDDELPAGVSEKKGKGKKTHNAADNQPRHPAAGTFQGKAANAAKRGHMDTGWDREADATLEGTQKAPDGRDLADLENEPEDDIIESADDHQDPKEGPKELKAKGVKLKIENLESILNYGDVPMTSGYGSPHYASKEAASASVRAENPKARDHALEASDKSREGDSDGASDSHLKAAAVHEKEATKIRKGKGDENDNASDHDNAAALHRKAASMHQAVMNGGPGSGRRAGLGKSTLPSHIHQAIDEATTEEGKTSGVVKAGGTHAEFRKGGDEVREHNGQNGHGPWMTRNQITTNEGVQVMNRDQQVQYLVANCELCGDEETLNSLSDQDLGNRVKIVAKAQANELIVNAARKNFGAGLSLGELAKVIANAKAKEKGDEEEEDDEEDSEMEKNADAGQASASGGGPGIQAGGKGTREEYGGQGGTHNRRVPLTKRLTPEELSVWNTFKRIHDNRHKELRETIVANLNADEAGNVDLSPVQNLLDRLANRKDATLNQLDVEGLEIVANYLGANRVPQQNHSVEDMYTPRPVNYFGGNGFGGQTQNTADQSDPLPILTMNDLHAEEAQQKEHRRRKA